MLSNHNSLKTQHALAGLQSRARLLNVVMDDAVASAGYHVNPTADKTKVFPYRSSIGNTPALTPGAAVASNKPTSGSTISYLRARFQAAGSLHDCNGNKIGQFPALKSVTTATKLTRAQSDFALLFSLNKNKPTPPTLYCEPYASNASIKNSKIEPLITNIRAFKTLFGLDTNGNGSVDKFVTHLKKAQQRQVVSIRVQALLQTKKNVLSAPIQHKRVFHFMDGSTLAVQNSRRAFLMFNRTVAIRNNL